MSEAKNKKTHIVSTRENDVGTERYCLLLAAAEKAAEAFKQGFYLEAITLTESLLATRLESRLSHIKRRQDKSEAAGFGTLAHLCKALLSDEAKETPGWEAYQVPIQEIRKWATQRNEALHEMAKLVAEDGDNFQEKYNRGRETALEGFRALLAYDAIDRQERGKVEKFTATDNYAGGTAFDCLRNLR